MKILLQSPLILDQQSPFHKKKKNVLIQSGRIADITDKTVAADRVLDASGMILSPGWFALGTLAGDPGFEHKESLESVAKAAAAGGFTEIALLPNTQPSIQTKNDIAYLTARNDSRLVQIHAMASVTKSNKGEEMTEMLDLHHAGAVAFTDGLRSIYNTDIFLKTLQYLRPINGVLVDHAHDHWLDLFGQMNEGTVSASLGLKGRPEISEEIAVSKNLKLLAYSESRLHLLHISAPKAVDLVRAAISKGLNVTCDITAYQALLDDSRLIDFDPNYKVHPPLRHKSANDKLIRGLKDGTISIITSGHCPQDPESKVVEFDHAEAGIINLQTVAAQLVMLAAHLPWEDLLEKITANPRKLLGVAQPVIAPGEKANLTLLDPDAEWLFDGESNLSKSANSPWMGQRLRGKVAAVFNNGKQQIHVG